jgi:hypothetical protein
MPVIYLLAIIEASLKTTKYGVVDVVPKFYLKYY